MALEDQHRCFKVFHTQVIFTGGLVSKACGQDDSHAGNHGNTRYGDLPLLIHGPVEGKDGKKDGKITRTKFIN